MEAIIDQPALGGALQNAAADPRELSEVVMDENPGPAKSLAVSPTALGADVRSLDTTPTVRRKTGGYHGVRARTQDIQRA